MLIKTIKLIKILTNKFLAFIMRCKLCVNDLYLIWLDRLDSNRSESRRNPVFLFLRENITGLEVSPGETRGEPSAPYQHCSGQV